MRTRGALSVTLFAVTALLWAGAVSARAATATAASLVVEVTDNVEGIAEYGSSVTFTYIVRNTGDDPITGIAVDDTLAGHLGDIELLAPGASQTFTETIVIEGAAAGGVGTCAAAGVGAQGQPVSASADYALQVFMGDNISDYAVSKQALAKAAVPGDVVRFRVRVRAVDEGIATAVTLVDDYDEKLMSVVDDGGGTVSGGRIRWDVPATVDDGTPFMVECSFRIGAAAQGDVTNVATLEADDPDPNDDNDTATARVTVAAAGQVSGDSGGGADAADADAAADPSDPGYLPFTGGPAILLPLVWLFASAGYALRRTAG